MSLKLHLNFIKQERRDLNSLFKMILAKRREDSDGIILQFFEESLKVFFTIKKGGGNADEVEEDYTFGSTSYYFILNFHKNKSYGIVINTIFYSPFVDINNRHCISVKMSFEELSNLSDFISSPNCDSFKVRIKTEKKLETKKIENFLICQIPHEQGFAWEKYKISLGKSFHGRLNTTKILLFSFFSIKLFENLSLVSSSFLSLLKILSPSSNKKLLIKIRLEEMVFYLSNGIHISIPITDENKAFVSFDFENFCLYYLLNLTEFCETLKSKFWHDYTGWMNFGQKNFIYFYATKYLDIKDSEGVEKVKNLEFAFGIKAEILEKVEFDSFMLNGYEGFDYVDS